MSDVKYSSDLGESVQEDQGLPAQPLLEYGRLPWMRSSQRATDLYNSGAKLWRKSDLEDIERQLSECYTTKNFTVRRVDGTTVQIPNPMCGVARPIWCGASYQPLHMKQVIFRANSLYLPLGSHVSSSRNIGVLSMQNLMALPERITARISWTGETRRTDSLRRLLKATRWLSRRSGSFGTRALLAKRSK